MVKDVTSDPAYLNVLEKAGDVVDYADAETTRRNWQKEYKDLFALIEPLEKETVRRVCKLGDGHLKKAFELG